MTDVALGIDVGTGSTKAGVVDADGRLLAVGRCAHPVEQPHPGWSETAPGRWLESTRHAVEEALAAVPDGTVVGLGLSGQMHGVVLCDAAGRPVRPAVLWPDRRAEAHVAPAAAALEPYLDTLANPLVPGMAGPILWALSREEPSRLKGARWALQPKDWLRLQLTGEVATDPTDASATLLWDLYTDTWSTEAASAFGVDPDLLPPALPSHARAGTLRPEAAASLGLPGELPVATGAADTAAALYGAGLAAGEAQVSTGSGGQIAVLLDRPQADPSRRTHLYRAVDDGWYAMAAIQNAGLAIDWALGVLRADLDEAADAARSTPPGANGVTFLPYLTGERTPHLNTGLTACWAGLQPGTGRADIIRAVFEGVAFALRDGLDALRAAEHTIDQALLAGGGSRAGWWRQMLADALGIPLVPHDATDASVRGAGLLGWRAAGAGVVDARTPVDRGPAIPPGVEDLLPSLGRFRALARDQVDAADAR